MVGVINLLCSSSSLYSKLSLEVPRLLLDLPIDESLEVVQHHVLVCLNLHVGLDYSEVDSSGIDILLDLNVVLTEEFEML